MKTLLFLFISLLISCHRPQEFKRTQVYHFSEQEGKANDLNYPKNSNMGKDEQVVDAYKALARLDEFQQKLKITLEQTAQNRNSEKLETEFYYIRNKVLELLQLANGKREDEVLKVYNKLYLDYAYGFGILNLKNQTELINNLIVTNDIQKKLFIKLLRQFEDEKDLYDDEEWKYQFIYVLTNTNQDSLRWFEKVVFSNDFEMKYFARDCVIGLVKKELNIYVKKDMQECFGKFAYSTDLQVLYTFKQMKSQYDKFLNEEQLLELSIQLVELNTSEDIYFNVQELLSTYTYINLELKHALALRVSATLIETKIPYTLWKEVFNYIKGESVETRIEQTLEIVSLDKMGTLDTATYRELYDKIKPRFNEVVMANYRAKHHTCIRDAAILIKKGKLSKEAYIAKMNSNSDFIDKKHNETIKSLLIQ